MFLELELFRSVCKGVMRLHAACHSGGSKLKGHFTVTRTNEGRESCIYLLRAYYIIIIIIMFVKG